MQVASRWVYHRSFSVVLDSDAFTDAILVDRLRDPNDLPDPADAEFWVGPGGERLTGPRPAPTAALDPKKLKESAEQSKKSMDVGVELREMESKVGSPVSEEGEEVVVLTDEEEEKLRDAQVGPVIPRRGAMLTKPSHADQVQSISDGSSHSLVPYPFVLTSMSPQWFRAHTTPTHHAFKMRTALYISFVPPLSPSFTH
jgi:hypothetical protein